MHEQKRRDLHNYLVTISQAMQRLQNQPASWDHKMKVFQDLSKLIPHIMRLLIYFKTVEENNGRPNQP